jgi:hypothetical protein
VTQHQVITSVAAKIIQTQCDCVWRRVQYWLLCVCVCVYVTVVQYIVEQLVFLYESHVKYGSARAGVARLLDSVIYSKDRKSFAIYHSI